MSCQFDSNSHLLLFILLLLKPLPSPPLLNMKGSYLEKSGLPQCSCNHSLFYQLLWHASDKTTLISEDRVKLIHIFSKSTHVISHNSNLKAHVIWQYRKLLNYMFIIISISVVWKVKLKTLCHFFWFLFSRVLLVNIYTQIYL